MRLNLKQLEAFVWVADLQSFRGAAARLNTTQPNISARIAALEDGLGHKLLIRDAGAVRLTAKGQALLSHARGVLAAADTLVHAADRHDLLTGTLRLGVTEMIAQTWLHDFLRDLHRAFPQVLVELTVGFSVNLEAGLAERSLDLTLQNEPFSRHFSGARPLGSYPLIWVAAPALGLGDGTIDAARLAAHPILTHARDTLLYQATSAHFAGKTAVAARLVPVSNLAACQRMIADGMGVGTLPAAMVAQDVARGALCSVAYDWVPDPLVFHARFEADKAPRLVAEAAEMAVKAAKSFDQKK